MKTVMVDVNIPPAIRASSGQTFRSFLRLVRLWRLLTLLLLSASIACGGGSGYGGNSQGGGGGGGGGGKKLYAPYIDMSLTQDEQLETIQQQSGIHGITLAFLVGTGSGCSLGWGGLGGTLPTDTLSDGTTIQSHVQNLQAAGIEVIISMGGANGADITSSCTSASSLQSAYQQVINQYHVSMLDFDIEGSLIADQSAIDLRDQALVGLKAANPGLVISFTIPVEPTGLDANGVNLLTSAHAAGLSLDVVNVMAMDFGACCDNGGQMGLDATDAATAAHSQVQQAGLSSSIGVTAMIGVNDTSPEVFQLSDANTLVTFANSNSYISRLTMWSLARDNGSCAGQTSASYACSGVSQTNYEFSQNFEQF
jgi:hypothetical protein